MKHELQIGDVVEYGYRDMPPSGLGYVIGRDLWDPDVVLIAGPQFVGSAWGEDLCRRIGKGSQRVARELRLSYLEEFGKVLAP